METDTSFEGRKLTRYEVRNSLFRIRAKKQGNEKLKEHVWNIIHPQLKPGESINDFTFTWDVKPNDPTEVIRRSDWDKIKKEKYPKHYDMQAKVEEEVTLFTAQK